MYTRSHIVPPPKFCSAPTHTPPHHIKLATQPPQPSPKPCFAFSSSQYSQYLTYASTSTTIYQTKGCTHMFHTHTLICCFSPYRLYISWNPFLGQIRHIYAPALLQQAPQIRRCTHQSVPVSMPVVRETHDVEFSRQTCNKLGTRWFHRPLKYP